MGNACPRPYLPVLPPPEETLSSFRGNFPDGKLWALPSPLPYSEGQIAASNPPQLHRSCGPRMPVSPSVKGTQFFGRNSSCD